MSTDFERQAKRNLTTEEITGLRAYKATTPNGNVVFIPRIKRYGQEIVWEARAHVKGAMGPVHATKAALQAIGAPEDFAEKVPAFLKTLQAQYPSLPAMFPETKSEKKAKALTEPDVEQGT